MLCVLLLSMFEFMESYKSFIIALILANNNVLHIELFNETCEEFWNKNVITHERKITFRKQNHYFHIFKNKAVFGYYCINEKIK